MWDEIISPAWKRSNLSEGRTLLTFSGVLGLRRGYFRWKKDSRDSGKLAESIRLIRSHRSTLLGTRDLLYTVLFLI